MMTLSSLQNPLVKEVRRAAQRGVLTPDGCAVAESPHLVEELLRSDCAAKAVLVAESAWKFHEARLPRGVPAFLVADAVFATLSTTETSQGLIALVRMPAWQPAELGAGGTPLLLLVDGVQDPGNVGTIARSAEALGATGLLFLKGSASPHAPKTLRAGAGSLFRMPHLAGLTPAAALDVAASLGCAVWSAMPHEGDALWDLSWREPCAFIVGSETAGVRPELQAASRPVRIPTGGVESLNAAMAATILLYEARRQRALGR